MQGLPALNRFRAGFLRGILAALALVLTVLAGLPQDRFAPAPQGGGTQMTGHAGSSHTQVAVIASAVTGDPDDGFDDAVRMVVPDAAAERPALRIQDAVRALGRSAAPIQLERPPRVQA